VQLQAYVVEFVDQQSVNEQLAPTANINWLFCDGSQW
jgi:hypothetical protein